MSDQFIGEVRMFGFSFAPTGWATCNGQIMSIQQNTALFSVLGTNFGGNGTTNFGLPNLADRLVVGAGAASSGTQYQVGESGGVTSVTLALSQLPAHTHAFQTAGARYPGTTNKPDPTMSLAPGTGCNPYVPAADNPTAVAMATNALSPSGTANPAAHNNMMAYGVVNYCIALQGAYPPRG